MPRGMIQEICNEIKKFALKTNFHIIITLIPLNNYPAVYIVWQMKINLAKH